MTAELWVASADCKQMIVIELNHKKVFVPNRSSRKSREYATHLTSRCRLERNATDADVSRLISSSGFHPLASLCRAVFGPACATHRRNARSLPEVRKVLIEDGPKAKVGNIGACY